MKLKPINMLFCAMIALFPVVLWNVILLDYINTNGKFLAWILTPVFSIASTGMLLGFSDAKKKPYSKGQVNPFYGWLFFTLAIEIFITAASNT